MGNGSSRFVYDKQGEFLITVNYFSDHWELDQLPDTLSSTVIAKTKEHFGRYGIPETVISDNGAQFCSHEYTVFAKDWDFTHVTSSPYHSQSNGKAESAVKIAKSLLKKARKDDADIYQAISIGETPQQNAVNIAHPRNSILGEPEQLFQQLRSCYSQKWLRM